MKKVCVLVAESCAGKDTVLNILIDKYNMNRVVSHTTRPMRPLEVEGREYYFVDNERFDDMYNNNLFVETRQYNTFQDGKSAVWKYGVSKQSVANQSEGIIILDLDGLKELEEYLGKDNVISFYIYVSDEVRLKRAFSRGDEEAEVLRRFEDDKNKFSDAKDVVTHIVYNESGKHEAHEIAKDIFRKFSEECTNE